VHQPGSKDRRYREIRRDHGLHSEQRKPSQCHELGEEADQVDAKAGDEAPLVQHAHHETGIDAGQSRLGWRVSRPEARRADSYRLHDRGDSVANRRHHGSYEARQHDYDPTPQPRCPAPRHS